MKMDDDEDALYQKILEAMLEPIDPEELRFQSCLIFKDQI